MLRCAVYARAQRREVPARAVGEVVRLLSGAFSMFELWRTGSGRRWYATQRQEFNRSGRNVDSVVRIRPLPDIEYIPSAHRHEIDASRRCPAPSCPRVAECRR